MAKATVEKVEISPAVPAVYEKTVTLVLSEEEAERLRSVVAKFNYAAHVSNIYTELTTALSRGDYDSSEYEVTLYNNDPVDTLTLKHR